MLCRAKPFYFEAVQWHKNQGRARPEYLGREGLTVEYYKPKNEGHTCRKCGKRMAEHGVILGGHILCPDDWIMTDVQGDRRVIKPEVFEACYEKVKEK